MPLIFLAISSKFSLMFLAISLAILSSRFLFSYTIINSGFFHSLLVFKYSFKYFVPLSLLPNTSKINLPLLSLFVLEVV